MNVLFIEFIGLFLLSLGVLTGLFLLIKNKKIHLRDLVVSGVFTVGFIILSLTGKCGFDLNYEISNQFKVSNEYVSHTDFKDSTINDKLLYKMIKDLRIPHTKIVFAQAKHESNHYKSDLYKTNFNLFGMKFATQRPSITTNEIRGYQAYDNWKESVIDLLIWQFSNRVDRLTDSQYLEYLHVKYAEDPQYMVKLNKMLGDTNFDDLENFDKPISDKQKK